MERDNVKFVSWRDGVPGNGKGFPAMARKGLRMPLESFLRFLRDETGGTAIEYALIGGAIALVIIVSVQTIGTILNTTFTTVATGLK